MTSKLFLAVLIFAKLSLCISLGLVVEFQVRWSKISFEGVDAQNNFKHFFCIFTISHNRQILDRNLENKVPKLKFRKMQITKVALLIPYL